MKKILKIFTFILFVFVFSGCNGLDKYVKDMDVQPEETVEKPWSLLIYVSADIEKDDAKLLLEEVKAVLKVGSSANMHIIAQVDFEGKKAKAQRYYVYKDKLAKRGEFENMNMGSPAALREFLEWGLSYKSDKKALMFMGKGTGWISLGNGQNKRSFAYSNTEGDCITLDEAKEVFSQVLGDEKFDVIAWNSGFMNQLEVAYQFRDFADYMIAAETDMPGIGYDYSLFTKPLITTDLEPQEFARRVFISGGSKHKFMKKRAENILKKIKKYKYDNWDDNDHYVPEIKESVCKKIVNSSYQMSLLDLRKLNDMTKDIKLLTHALKEYNKKSPEEIKYSIDFAKRHSACFAPLFKELDGKKEYVDLNDFLMELYNRLGDDNILQIIQNTVEDLYKVVIDKYHDGKDVKFSMLSVYMPEDMEFYRRNLEYKYKELDFVKSSDWNELFELAK